MDAEDIRQEKIWPTRSYDDLYRQSMEDSEGFWAEQARRLDWSKPWDKVLDWNPPFARWFVGGELNASVQCVDRHAKSWRKNKVAIYWEGEPGDTQVLSYATLYREVNRYASVLRNLGVEKGDRVVIYLPMIPEMAIFMLACARIGAIHSVVFSGFSAQALTDRIDMLQAKVVITSDGGYRRGRVLALKEIVDRALEETPSIEHCIMVQRTGTDVTMREGRDLLLSALLAQAEEYTAPVPVEATHPLYVLYTSGTTGRPKGIVHSTGGYMVYTHSVFQWAFNLRDDSVYWCTADAGWVTGHTAIVYAPLAHGASIVMYEGSPDTPQIDRWWSIIEKYGVTTLYTSPTAIRMFMVHGEQWPQKHDLSSLELLGSVGEAINPEAWWWYYRHIGGERCPIVDTWWQTETGGFMISPSPGIEPQLLKPGSATRPMPGVEPEVVDEDGSPTPDGERGFLVLRRPWPGMLQTVYNDEETFKKTYWERFPGSYYAGDYAIRDEEGYFWLLGRADEVLKVAGHRLGSLELENTTVEHQSIAEAAAVGVPDDIKGEEIVIFAILTGGTSPSDELKMEIIRRIRETIGPFAAPKAVHFVRALPKTRSGKIMRRLLRAVATGQTTGDVSTLEDGASVEEIKHALEELGAV